MPAVNVHIVYRTITTGASQTNRLGPGKKNSKVVRTRNWSEAAEIIENILGSRYLLGAQIGDWITIKYVHEEWDGQWQHHYKIVVKHLETKCATCGFAPPECICDNPVV